MQDRTEISPKCNIQTIVNLLTGRFIKKKKKKDLIDTLNEQATLGYRPKTQAFTLKQ